MFSLRNKVILSQPELIRKFFISYNACKSCFCLLKVKQMRLYLTFQRFFKVFFKVFLKNMASDLDHD